MAYAELLPPQYRIAWTDVLVRDRRDHGLAHAVGGVQAKLLALIIEHVDRARVGARQVHRPADDGGEHSFEIERRVYRLRHLPKRAQLLDRAAKFIGALAQFVQQSRIFDSDDGLICESRHEFDLLLSKWVHPFAAECEDTDRGPLTLERHTEDSSVPDGLLMASRLVFAISQHVRDMNCPAL